MKTSPLALGCYIPIIVWLPAYSRTWLRGDIIAGVTLAAPESLD